MASTSLTLPVFMRVGDTEIENPSQDDEEVPDAAAHE